MLILVSILIVLAMAYVSIAFKVVGKYGISTRNWVSATVLVAWTAGVGVKLYLDQTALPENELFAAGRALGAAEWNVGDSALRASRATSGVDTSARGLTAADGNATAIEAPPIDSLVTGLEARLAREPNDANGWALLAQTYAFVGDAEGAGRAMAKAIELGVDEATLRERVRVAMREMHPSNWTEQAVGG